MTNKNVNQKYDGSSNEKGLPNGNGTLTTYWDDKVRCIEQGFWQEGFLVEGSETIFWQDWDKERAYTIKKEIGKWRYDKDKNFCEEFISGEGEELYFETEQDLKNNNPLGYVRGIFENGTLIKGEIFNAFKIDYSDHSFVKKIILKGKSKTNKNKASIGEIFFENGDWYKGELDFDRPHGKGTMHYKEDSTKLEGEWVDGNIKDGHL